MELEFHPRPNCRNSPRSALPPSVIAVAPSVGCSPAMTLVLSLTTEIAKEANLRLTGVHEFTEVNTFVRGMDVGVRIFDPR
jgi:hypothetical protein